MDWTEQFSGLSTLELPYKATLLEHSKRVEIPANTKLFGPGTQPDSLVLLLEGGVRVQQISESGKEIILYRISAGESCIMTTICLLTFEDYSAHGVAETDLVAIAVPREVVDQLLADSAKFRQFIFNAFAKRISDLFSIVSDVAFQRVDVRLSQKLIELAGPNKIVLSTHQQLAAELGTAREVISRQLGELQRKNWIEQSRGSITIVDIENLRQLSSS